MADSLVAECIGCRKKFNLFIRRHHCRRCGRIFCNECSSNRLTNLGGTDDKNHYRLCNSCVDELVDNEQAIPVPIDRCGLGFALRYRRVVAAIPTVDDLPRSRSSTSSSSSSSSPLQDDNLLRFDEELIVDAAPVQMYAASPLPYAPMVSPGSTPTNDSVFVRIASAALSLPARLRANGNRPSEPVYTDATLESCPVCSQSFRKWDGMRMQNHIEQCISKTERAGSVQGDRYTTYKWPTEADCKECSICYEEFAKGQAIAVMNCLCQFHELCIKSWFERGKFCPFHTG